MIMPAQMEVTITRYHESYDPEISRLCQAFSDESLKEYGLEVENERLEQMIEVCKDISFFLCVDGKPVGLIAGFIINNLTNGRPALQEVIWYVDKPYRSNGRQLLNYFEEAAKNLGCYQVVMALMCNSGAEKLDSFYKRMGYKPFEVQYMKEIA
jgi:GNAT superfamily N-acetyltransferase